MLHVNFLLLRKYAKEIMFLTVISVAFVVIHYDDYKLFPSTQYGKNFIEPRLENCDFFTERVVTRLVLYCVSDWISDNPRLLPFIFTILMFPMTFLLSRKLSENTMSPFVATSTLFFSRIFSFQSYTVSGDVTWCFFLLLGFYLINRYKKVSIGSLLLSITMKGVGILLIPLFLYWVRKNGNDRTMIVVLSVIFGIVVLSSFVTSVVLQPIAPTMKSPDVHSLLYIFRDDSFFFFYFVLTTMAGLAYFSIRNDQTSKFILLFVVYYYCLSLLLPMFSSYAMFDYRMIPMIVFVSVGFGHIVGKIIKPIIEKKTLDKSVILLLFMIVPVALIGYGDNEYVLGFKEMDLPIFTVVKTLDLYSHNEIKLHGGCTGMVDRAENKSLVFKVVCDSDSSPSSIRKSIDMMHEYARQVELSIGK